MKTYEIKMSRSRWINLLISILLIVILVMLCSPYFTYGDDMKSLIPQNGNSEHLLTGVWEMKGSDSTQDGYQEIVFNDAKNMTVRTTNIIRVNQLAADEAVAQVYKDFEAIKAQVLEANTTYQKAAAVLAEVQAAFNIVDGLRPAEVAADAATPAPDAQPEATENAAPSLNFGDIDKFMRNANTAAENARTNFLKLNEYYETAKKAVVEAYEGGAMTYQANASMSWVTEYNIFNELFLPLEDGEELPEELLAQLNECLSEADVAEVVKAKKDGMTGQEMEDMILAKLDAEKVKAAEGVKITLDAASATKSAAKDATSDMKKVTKGLTDSEKALKNIKESILEALPETVFATAEEPVIADITLEEPKFVAYEKGSAEQKPDEPVLMETKGTVSYKEKKDKDTYELTLKFLNGDVYETSYSTSVNYAEKKQISILGYIGFPYNAEDFSTEMTYKINNFYINSVVLVPILLMVLSVLGIVICFLKRDKLASGIVPAAVGLLGIIGYLTSDFLKLGDKFTMHIIIYAVVLAISVVHILLHIKEKKAR